MAVCPRRSGRNPTRREDGGGGGVIDGDSGRDAIDFEVGEGVTGEARGGLPGDAVAPVFLADPIAQFAGATIDGDADGADQYLA